LLERLNVLNAARLEIKRQIAKGKRQKVGTFLFYQKISSALLPFAICLLPFDFSTLNFCGLCT